MLECQCVCNMNQINCRMYNKSQVKSMLHSKGKKKPSSFGYYRIVRFARGQRLFILGELSQRRMAPFLEPAHMDLLYLCTILQTNRWLLLLTNTVSQKRTLVAIKNYEKIF